jgi:hypothetical protein
MAYLKKVPKHTVSEYKDKKTITKANPFSIANTLATGNGSAIWVVYQGLINQGFAPEELFGIIWWKLKDIAKKKTTISDSFKKTLHTFMSTYADARATAGDLGTGLEKTLEEAKRRNESAESRVIGMAIETRPDWIDIEEIKRIRRYGVTRVEIGYQTTIDRINEINKR